MFLSRRTKYCATLESQALWSPSTVAWNLLILFLSNLCLVFSERLWVLEWTLLSWRFSASWRLLLGRQVAHMITYIITLIMLPYKSSFPGLVYWLPHCGIRGRDTFDFKHKERDSGSEAFSDGAFGGPRRTAHISCRRTQCVNSPSAKSPHQD